MSRDESLTRQLDAARQELARLTEQAERNSRILARSQARELSLLKADDLPTLFHAMLDGLRESYGLDEVSVAIADPDHEIRQLLQVGGGDPPSGLLFAETLSDLSSAYTGLSASWLGEYRAAEHRGIFDEAVEPGSVALIPLMQNDRTFGAINFASVDRRRFQSEHATDFLNHLGVIAAFAVENAVNRARLRRSGFTDVLTGLYNRRYLLVRLVEELARARRHAAPVACLMLDVDHFKRVNDEFGHAAGDEVLRELAEKIAKRIRATDVAARYGGEEFVILLPGTGAEAGVAVADTIRKTVAATRFGLASDIELGITVSIGVSESRPGKNDTAFKSMGNELIARADRALYRAKSGGRNRVEMITDD